MYEGYTRYAASRARAPLKAIRYVKRTRPGTFRGRPVGPYARPGYGSIARARGAAVQGEMKYFDCELDETAIAVCTTTWVAGTSLDPTRTINLGSASVNTPLCLMAPTVGAALNQRIGRKVKMFKVKIRGILRTTRLNTLTQALDGQVLRYMLVMDKQTNAGQMTGAQLMNAATNALETISTFQNPNNFGRFRVLKDKYARQSQGQTTGSPTTGDVIIGGYAMPFKCSYRFKKPVEVHFNATNGGTVADIIDNSLHFLIACDDATLNSSVSYYSRVSYKE